VARQNWRTDVQQIESLQNIVRQPLVIVTRLRVTRRAESASRDAVNMGEAGQFAGEVIEDMGGIAGAGEQHQWSSGTAPIEHLQPDSFLHRDELDSVWGGVVPGSGFLRTRRSHQ
jgi:hypothetical protein